MLHPTRVQIVELIHRAGRPLSAADLVERLGSSPCHIECHLRCLRHLGVILPSGSSKRGRRAFTQRYQLKDEPKK